MLQRNTSCFRHIQNSKEFSPVQVQDFQAWTKVCSQTLEANLHSSTAINSVDVSYNNSKGQVVPVKKPMQTSSTHFTSVVTICTSVRVTRPALQHYSPCINATCLSVEGSGGTAGLSADTASCKLYATCRWSLMQTGHVSVTQTVRPTLAHTFIATLHKLTDNGSSRDHSNFTRKLLSTELRVAVPCVGVAHA